MSRQQIFRNILLTISAAFLLTSSVYVAYKESQLNLLNSDVFSYNTLLEGGYQKNDIHVSKDHSQLLIYPLVILENALGLSPQVHMIFSILLLIGMNFGIGLIIYIVSKKNKLVTASLCIALSTITLLYSLQNFFWGYSAMTLRNIGIPLTIGSVLMLTRISKIISLKFILLCLLLLINFISDNLTMAIVVLSTILYLLVSLVFSGRSFKSQLKSDKNLLVAIFTSAIAAKLLELILTKTGLLVFDGTSSLRITKNVETLFENIAKLFNDLLNIFGANIFNKSVSELLFYGINLLILIALIALYGGAIKKYSNIKSSGLKIIIFIIPSTALMYLLISGAAIDRYLTYVPVSLLVVAAYTLREAKIQFNKTAMFMIPSILLITFGVFFAFSRTERASMNIENYNLIAPQLTKTVEVSEVLEHEKVTALTGDYWIIHTTKFYYDSKSNEKLLVVPTKILSENVLGYMRFISRDSWLKNPVSGRFAYALNVADPSLKEGLNPDTFVKRALGEYVKKTTVDRYGQKVNVYIFDQDIRNKLLENWQ